MFSPEFLLTTLVIVLAPGTGVIYTVATGLGRGRRASVFAALGCTGATVLHLCAALLGLAALLHASALAFQLVKWAGAAYLIYLAIQTLRGGGPLKFEADKTPASLLRTAWTGFIINILNPKISVFFLAFLPQFVASDSTTPLLDILALGGIFVGMTLVVFLIYGLFAGLARQAVLSSKRAMSAIRYLTAAAFGGMGLKLALERS